MQRVIVLLSLLTCHYFLVFVFTKTVHLLLEAYMMALKYGMAKCFQRISKVCDFSGEKNGFILLKRYKSIWTQSYLLSLLSLLKSQLNGSQFKMNIARVQECYQKIVTIPRKISIDSMLTFISDVILKTISDLIPKILKLMLNGGEKAINRRQQQADQMLVPIRRDLLARNIAWTMAAVVNVRANAHVLIEFGLELWQLTLERGNLLKITYQPFVVPFILIVNDSFGSKQVRAATDALKYITIIINKQISLKRLDAAISSILENIFFQPMQRAFKTITYVLGIDQKRICQC